jgi:hypothetical protein
MKKCTKQYLCIFAVAFSLLLLLYIYLATQNSIKEGTTNMFGTGPDNETKQNNPNLDVKPSTTSKGATVYKTCASITGGQEECARTQYGSGIGNLCIYDTVNKRCIRPAQEYNPDGSVIDDGTSGPEERISDIKEVDVKTGL